MESRITFHGLFSDPMGWDSDPDGRGRGQLEMLCGRPSESCAKREDEQPSDGLERAGVWPDVRATGIYEKWW